MQEWQTTTRSLLMVYYINYIYNYMLFTKLAISPVPTISIQITTSGSPMLGQNIYTLTCNESLPDNFNHTITYKWTKDNGTQTQVGLMKNLSLSPLKLSDAGQYTCHAIGISPHLSINTTASESRDLRLQSESGKKCACMIC